MKKFIIRILLIILIILIIVLGYIIGSGYLLYKSATTKVSMSDKIEKIKWKK